MPDRSSLLSLAVVCVAVATSSARPLAAQVAGVIEPPPRRAPPPPPAAVAAGPRIDAAARRDSLSLRQRLDIQAWVDSAAGALARGAPASTVPLTPPPPAARPDTTRRATPARRPLARTGGAAWAVAAVGTRW